MSKIIKLKDLPEDERPYEKCLNNGPEVLTDSELLAVIIRTGSVGEQSIDLANRILNLCKSETGILGILHLSIKELIQVKGIGKVKAIQIKCIAELSRRISKASARNQLMLTNPETIANYYMEDLRHQEREQLVLLMLNTKNMLIQDMILFQGTVNSSIVSAREIYIEALKYHAVHIILVHNHPSGDPTPSREDILITKQLKDAGNLIGISLIDHIIIGDNKYISLNEEGIL